MIEYSFPGDLLDRIKTRWQQIPDEQFALPEDTILRRLLETCYHASFRTSEQRLVQCVVAYVSPGDVPQEALLLTDPVQMTDSELVHFLN